MTISQYGKSYDSADGSEQHHEGTTEPTRGEASRSARERWEDDGGPIAKPVAPSAPAGEFASKPGWSVLSLRDLNEAIRITHDPVRLRAEEAQRIERQRLLAAQAQADRADRAARAERNRYRNAWEYTD